MSAVLLITGVSQAAVLQDAISWAYDKGLTSFNTDTSFMPNNNLRRDEASKFLVEFAELVGMNTDDMLRNCSFSDVEKSRPDLKGYVATSCQYNILKGNNGEFWPDQSLTNAQIVTAVVRILDNGGLQSES